MRADSQISDDHTLRRLDRLADLLDSHYRIPATGFTIGLDGVIGLIPVVGDLATTALSLYIVAESARYDLPKFRLFHMGWNVAVDGVIGSIPVFGDLFDIGWKANRKNLDLLRRELRNRREREMRAQ